MAILQSTYSDDHRAAVAGMIANPATCDIDSRVVKGTTPIPFGVGVQQGTVYNEVIAGVAAHKFVGISVLDSTLQPIQGDEYVAGDVMSVMYRGDIWVAVENPVLVGDNVKADPVSGKLSSTEDQVLERVTVTAGGANYAAATTSITFSGGGGSGAAAEAVIVGGVITAIEVTAGGSGYTGIPTVAITDTGSGGGATAVAVIADAVAIPQARWMTTASKAGDLARVRLSGTLPSV